jgi:hypothetical protein
MTTTEESKIPAAAEVKDEIKSQGQEVASSAKQEVGALAQEVRAQAGNVVGNARDQLEEQADAQTRKIGEGIQTARRQLQSMTQGAEPGMVTSLAQQLADSLGSIGDTIDRGGVRALADDVRSFARRQPGLFLIGAGAAGFLTARLLRHAGDGASLQQPTHVDSTSTAQGAGGLVAGSVSGGGIDADLGLPLGQSVQTTPGTSDGSDGSDGRSSGFAEGPA